MPCSPNIGGVQLPAPTSTTGYLLPAQHPPQSSTSMGRYPSSLPTSTAPGVTHRLPSQAPTSSTYMGLSQPQNMRQPGTAGSTQAGPPPTHPSSTQAGPPPTHPSSTQAGPPPTHPSSTQAGPPPTHPSSTQAGPPPTHPSSTQAGPPPTHPSSTQAGPPPTHPGGTQSGPPPTHPGSVQAGPPPTHPSSTQSGPPPTHPSSTQSGPPPTHPSSTQAGPPPTHPGSVQSGPPPTHPGSVQSGPPPTHPGSVQAWPLPIGTGPPSAKQTLGRPPSGQLTGKLFMTYVYIVFRTCTGVYMYTCICHVVAYTVYMLASYPGRSLIKKRPGNLSEFKLLTSAALELAVPIRFQIASRDGCGISFASYITVY